MGQMSEIYREIAESIIEEIGELQWESLTEQEKEKRIIGIYSARQDYDYERIKEVKNDKKV